MSRVAIDLGVVQIYWYSLFILLGILIASFIIYVQLKKENIDIDKFFDMAIMAVIIGILGARIYYVIFNLNYYSKHILEIFRIWNGGLAIHGGLIFGFIYIYYWTKKRNINTLKYLDIILLGVIIAQAIGRWGNFFNQEAYGSITTLSNLKNMHLPEFIIKGMFINGYYRMPTFLYESIWNIIGFTLIIFIKNIKDFTGLVTSIYLIWYSLGRFIIESYRIDSLMLGSFKMAQIVSSILFIIGIYLLIISIKKVRE